MEFFCTVENFLILKKLQSLKKLQKVTETVLRSCAAQIVNLVAYMCKDKLKRENLLLNPES